VSWWEGTHRCEPCREEATMADAGLDYDVIVTTAGSDASVAALRS
jgi:hypothetical protein